MDGTDELFERRLTYPDAEARRLYRDLVGLDDAKSTLAKSISVFLDPTSLLRWAERFHVSASALVKLAWRRPPLLILAGDVGTGKTQLAESVGDNVARELGIGITLLPISLSTRGSGRVGEMTKLLSLVFDSFLSDARRIAVPSGRGPRAGTILLLDEADALTQSRETTQMHHEDRAGVNAFVRGIDRIADSRVPAAVIMCTNRLSAIDPAVQRRAAHIIEFTRPNKAQAVAVLKILAEVGLSDDQISEIAEVATAAGDSGVGFTYSDLTQRLLPSAVLEAYPNGPIGFDTILSTLSRITPTPPFRTLY